MSAKTSTWENMRREHIEIASEHPLPPQDMNHVQKAKEAMKGLTSYAIFAASRKAVPRNALPTEVLVALLAPNYTRKPQTPALQSPEDKTLDHTTKQISTKHIQFVPGPAWPEDPSGAVPLTHNSELPSSSYKAPKLLTPHTKNALLTLHTHIERTGQTPLVWHRSQGSAINKHNNKKGAEGSRLIHVLDPMGKAFYSKNMPKQILPTMILASQHIDEENTQPSVRTAQTSNSPVPNATSSTTTMTVLMHFAVQVMRRATTYVKIIFSIRRMMLHSANNDTGTAAQ